MRGPTPRPPVKQQRRQRPRATECNPPVGSRQPGPAPGSRMDGATVTATSDLPDAPLQ
jgi:hypothetical protein